MPLAVSLKGRRVNDGHNLPDAVLEEFSDECRLAVVRTLRRVDGGQVNGVEYVAVTFQTDAPEEAVRTFADAYAAEVTRCEVVEGPPGT